MEESHTPQPAPHLYRSETDRILAGVAGGLGEYFGIDSTIIRLIFILLAFAGGTGILIYLVLALLIPSRHLDTDSPRESFRKNAEQFGEEIRAQAEKFRGQMPRHHADGRFWAGVVILLLGLYFLLHNLGVLAGFDLGKVFWPGLLILLGVVILTRDHHG